MGVMQSRRRDSYNQAPYEFNTHFDETMGRCSTFNDIPAWATPPAKLKISLNARPSKPPSKRQKYDPTYVIWKSALEDKSIRTPRTLLPIKEEKAALQNITDAVAGQRTPNGFPSFTDLRETMRRKKAVKRQDATDHYEAPNNTSLTNAEGKQNKKETSPSATDKEETTENCYQTAFDFPKPNENLFSDDDDEKIPDHP